MAEIFSQQLESQQAAGLSSDRHSCSFDFAFSSPLPVHTPVRPAMRVDNIAQGIGLLCIGWLARGLVYPQQYCPAVVPCPEAIRCPTPPAPPPPAVSGGIPAMTRGIVHGLMNQIQFDDPYIATKG